MYSLNLITITKILSGLVVNTYRNKHTDLYWFIAGSGWMAVTAVVFLRSNLATDSQNKSPLLYAGLCPVFCK